jgi:hypothetical protein
MADGTSIPIYLIAYHAIPWILGAILSGLAYRYRHTWWGRLALREFGLRRNQYESEPDFQRRRGTIWLWISALWVLFTYIAGQRWLEHEPDAPLWEFLAVFFGVIFCFWSFGISFRAFIASRLASKRQDSPPPAYCPGTNRAGESSAGPLAETQEIKPSGQK